LQFYNVKIIKSGHVIEIYFYEKEQARGYTPKKNNPSALDQGETEDRRKDNLNRTKQNLRRIINTNSKELQKFITLTFKNNITCLDKAHYEFEKFVKRMKYRLKKVIAPRVLSMLQL